MRPIDADELKTWFGEKDIYSIDYIYGIIDDMPTIEPERKKGEWIVTSEFEDCRYVKCNQCKVT